MKRKGANKVSDIPIEKLTQLEAGTLESATLTEGLGINFSTLVASLYPELQNEAVKNIDPKVGISKRMAQTASLLVEAKGSEIINQLEIHASDTVRGWAAFAIAGQLETSLKDKLAQLKKLANDDHFGVREWAWLAVRPFIVNAPVDAITLLQPWAGSTSSNIRRFAVEVVRPRGVWSKHIEELKKSPHLAMPILDQVKSDTERYVQNSVGNWLNDAYKSQPEWVNKICTEWLAQSATKETEFIVKRGLRSQTKAQKP